MRNLEMMIASILTHEDIRTAFSSMILISAVLALMPLLRFKAYGLSITVTAIVYGAMSIRSWFLYSDTVSSACPEFSAFLWPLFSALLGLIYLAAHLRFRSKYLLEAAAIALFLVWMILLADWSLIDKISEAYKMLDR